MNEGLESEAEWQPLWCIHHFPSHFIHLSLSFSLCISLSSSPPPHSFSLSPTLTADAIDENYGVAVVFHEEEGEEGRKVENVAAQEQDPADVSQPVCRQTTLLMELTCSKLCVKLQTAAANSTTGGVDGLESHTIVCCLATNRLLWLSSQFMLS